MTKKKKRIMIISIVITLVILSVAALYANLKVFTIKKVFMSAQQEVYIMGTFHTEHFERYANYSIEEMINLDYSRQCRESGRKPHSYRILTEYYFSPIK